MWDIAKIQYIKTFFHEFLFQVLVPLLSNPRNHAQWPSVVSQDVLRHVNQLKSDVYVVAGRVEGKTLLPLPVGSEQVEEADTEAETGDKSRFVQNIYIFVSSRILIIIFNLSLHQGSNMKVYMGNFHIINIIWTDVFD